MIALLCSFGMAAAALTFYGDRVVERTSQSRVKTAALALSGQAFDSSVLKSIAASGGRYGLIQGRPGPEPYPYLHTLDYLKVSQDSAAYSGKESISQTHWTAWLRGRDDARVWTQDG